MEKRIKFLFRLLIRIIFVVMCFIITFLFTTLESYQTDEIIMTSSLEKPYFDIETKNGATVESTIDNNIIVLDIVQNGDTYDDIIIKLKTSQLKYDTTYLESMMGDKQEYTEYIEDMKTGPWSANLNYRLMGNSVVTTGSNKYSIKYQSDVFTESLSSKAANKNNKSSELIVFENDEFTVDILLGTSSSGALPSGKYYLYVNLNISGLYGEKNPKLSFVESIPAFIKLSINALETVPVDRIFNVSSWLTFYFIMVVFGCLFFAYSDLRAAFGMATAGKSDVRKVVYSIFIDGRYSGEYITYTGTAAFSLVGFLIAYIILLFTIPIRIVLQIISSIIHIICGDSNESSDPLFANIIGSIGIYFAMAAFIGLIGTISSNGNYIIFIILALISIVLLIFAKILLKRINVNG